MSHSVLGNIPETCDSPNPSQTSTTISPSSLSTNNFMLLRQIVVPRVAAYWDEVSDYLEYEPEYQHLIRKKCHNDPWECCLELLKDWFSSNRGILPKSLPKLVDVLRDIPGHATTAEKIAKDLANAGVKLVECNLVKTLLFSIWYLSLLIIYHY